MAHKYNFNTLMANNPTEYSSMVNSIGQTIHFMEHPIHGDQSEVICVCMELKLAQDSTFFETDDMIDECKEYEPKFIDGDLHIGDFEA